MAADLAGGLVRVAGLGDDLESGSASSSMRRALRTTAWSSANTMRTDCASRSVSPFATAATLARPPPSPPLGFVRSSISGSTRMPYGSGGGKLPAVSGVGTSEDRPFRVVIAGGGIAGLEGMLAIIDLAGGLVEVDLVSPGKEFVYRPMLVAEPFGRADALRLDLAKVTAEAGARHIEDSLASVDPAAREALTVGGQSLRYDALLVALGARPLEAVPGALTFAGEPERRRFAELLRSFGNRGERRLAFVVPPEASWSVAAYELALLTAAERDARGLHGTEITLVTHEPAPLSLFGVAASQLVTARLDEAGIAFWGSSRARRFEGDKLLVDDGGSLAFDEVVALPALEVPPLPGLPQRGRGFFPTDVQMHVAGLEAVWAAGDATSFPVKQGGVAAQQADAAARAIAARAGATFQWSRFNQCCGRC